MAGRAGDVFSLAAMIELDDIAGLMRPLRRGRVTRAVLWGLWAVAVAAVVQGSLSAALAPPGAYGLDKAVHFAAYACLAGIPALLLGAWRRLFPWVLGLLLLGGVLELAQVWLAAREASLLDLACNVVGTAVGARAGLWLARVETLAWDAAA